MKMVARESRKHLIPAKTRHQPFTVINITANLVEIYVLCQEGISCKTENYLPGGNPGG